MASLQDKLEQNEAAAAELLARGFLNSTVLAVTVPRADLDTGNPNPPQPNEYAAAEHVQNVQKRNGNTLGSIEWGAPSIGTKNAPGPPSTSFSFRVGPTGPPARTPPGRYATHGRTALADFGTHAGLHPVIRLGWQPICSVVCNGLQGELLGGHDRDIFIRCTSGNYANLPLIDTAAGGCIMTCSQFEKLAGRELSKKWKESIHVVGEGEGSKATLISWLKRRAEGDFGHKVIGRQVWVCWCADADYYQGTIIHYNRDSGKHTVQYNSRLTEDLHLPVELLSFQTKKPEVPMTCTPPQAAGPQQAGGGDGDDPHATMNGIWHQGSGVSVSSMIVSEDHTSGGSSGQGKHRRSRQGMLARGVSKDDEQRYTDSEVERPPKRTVSAPASVLLAAMPSANLGNGGMDSSRRRCMNSQSHELPGKSPATGPVTPMQHLHSKHWEECGATVTLPPPPRIDQQGEGRNDNSNFEWRALGWMDEVALCLDDEMGSTMGAMGAMGREPGGSLRAGPTVSGTFQAMIALLRSCPTALEGLFQGMMRRYDHFAGDPILQRRKLCEFIASSVHEPLLHHVLRLALPHPGFGMEGVRKDGSK